jgi:pyruvate/2-oxoglutarate dehydrogenase complex dihydrolipoamide dehydrogenase (E3) component
LAEILVEGIHGLIDPGFGQPAVRRDSLLPYGIYTIPEISMVGRTEQELNRAGVPYESGTARYEEIARACLALLNLYEPVSNLCDQTARSRLICMSIMP